VEAERVKDRPGARPAGRQPSRDAGGDGQGRRGVLDNIAADLQTTAGTQGIAVTFARNGQDIVAKFAEANEDKVTDFVKKTYAVLEFRSRRAGELVYGLQSARANELKEEAVRQAKDRTERRINKFGVAEPNVYKQGRDQLVIQLPASRIPRRPSRSSGPRQARVQARGQPVGPGEGP